MACKRQARSGSNHYNHQLCSARHRAQEEEYSYLNVLWLAWGILTDNKAVKYLFSMPLSKTTKTVLPIAAFVLSSLAQSASDVAYQNRGRYNEGVRTEPSTGPLGLELVGAMLDYQEPSAALPPKLCAQFYLPIQDDVDLTIREKKPVYFYWLDKIHPESAWKSGMQNRFEWRTDTVIRALNWESSPLTIDQLSAVVRIGRLTPSNEEQVAPVALYHSRPPDSITGYRFIFRPTSQMRLRFEVFSDGGTAPLSMQELHSVLADQPLEVTWKAKDWKNGWYRLVVTGYTLSGNSRTDKVVRFYHAQKN